jgi:hypothetical protein
MTLETTMSYREVIVGGAIVGFFVVLSMAAEPWLGSDQSSVTDVIQLALTPAFLLTAVAALLNVFSTRLGRVADRVHLLSADLQRGTADTEFLSAQLDFLRRRSLILDVAVMLATVGGAATCAAVLVLFLGALGNADVSIKALRAILFGLFGGAIVFTLAALVTFLIEMIMAGRGLRVVCCQLQKTADKKARDSPQSELNREVR